MCGRYYSLFDKQQVAEHFHVRRTADNVGIIAPNYNVAPGDPQPVIRRSRDTGERELVMMRWGIVPWFAKSELEFKKLSTINAKSDRLTDSKMWREPFAKRRCLVPASGLYEWPKPGHAISDTYSDEETASRRLHGTARCLWRSLWFGAETGAESKNGQAHQARLQHHSGRARPVRLRRHLGRMEAAGWNIP
jgi:putative SOS response-associated peptidase YedK